MASTVVFELGEALAAVSEPAAGSAASVLHEMSKGQAAGAGKGAGVEEAKVRVRWRRSSPGRWHRRWRRAAAVVRWRRDGDQCWEGGCMDVSSLMRLGGDCGSRLEMCVRDGITETMSKMVPGQLQAWETLRWSRRRHRSSRRVGALVMAYGFLSGINGEDEVDLGGSCGVAVTVGEVEYGAAEQLAVRWLERWPWWSRMAAVENSRRGAGGVWSAEQLEVTVMKVWETMEPEEL